MALSIDSPVLLQCDSIGAVAQAKEPKSLQRTKHILHCYHLIRKIMNQSDIDLQKIDEKKDLTDPFTKALKIKKFDDYKLKIGI